MYLPTKRSKYKYIQTINFPCPKKIYYTKKYQETFFLMKYGQTSFHFEGAQSIHAKWPTKDHIFKIQLISLYTHAQVNVYIYI